MDVVDALYRLGGVASHRALVAATSRWHVRAAVQAGRIERAGHGVYALPGVDSHAAAARGLNGLTSHLSAARSWQWPVWRTPERPWVTVPRKRRVPATRRRGIQLVWQDVPGLDGATTPLQTVLDCAARLPFEEALAVADSALRSGAVSGDELAAAGDALGQRWRTRVCRVAQQASPLADNPFESVVRAHALGVAGLRLVPQVQVVGYGRGDLVDVERRLIVECDSFGFHASRGALLGDIERYNRAAEARATIVRFGYEHAHQPRYITETLRRVIERPPQRQDELPFRAA